MKWNETYVAEKVSQLNFPWKMFHAISLYITRFIHRQIVNLLDDGTRTIFLSFEIITHFVSTKATQCNNLDLI